MIVEICRCARHTGRHSLYSQHGLSRQPTRVRTHDAQQAGTSDSEADDGSKLCCARRLWPTASMRHTHIPGLPMNPIRAPRPHVCPMSVTSTASMRPRRRTCLHLSDSLAILTAGVLSAADSSGDEGALSKHSAARALHQEDPPFRRLSRGAARRAGLLIRSEIGPLRALSCQGQAREQVGDERSLIYHCHLSQANRRPYVRR